VISRSRCLALAAALLVTSPALAGLKDIRTEKLPQRQAVQKAYADMVAVEDYARQWNETWHYGTPKNDVVSLVKTSLGTLQDSLGSAPENAELLLLTGLVAHYAYNLEVEETYKVAVDALEKARTLAPEDYRAEWFLGIHECQAGQSKEGMERLLAIEGRFSWKQLPSNFWDDYLYCANLTNMPAHALRAGDRATKLEPEPWQDREFQMEIARKRLIAPDSAATYPRQEVWRAERTDSRVVFTATMFGFQFSSYGDWKLQLPDVQNDVCMAVIQTGPYTGKAGDLLPNILVIARPPKLGETVADFAKSSLPKGYLERARELACPFEGCVSFELVKPDAYGSEGDGHVVILVFQRETPAFPGLLFETPATPPASESGKMAYFRPVERLRRLEGTLYYLVALDSANSVLQKAKADFETFLKGVRVE